MKKKLLGGRMLSSLGLLAARVLLSLIFILAGSSKFLDYPGMAAYMASKGFPLIPFFLYAAAILELVGGLSVMLGWKARWGALLLILFLIPTSLIFHDFWNVPPQEKQLQMAMFFKNLAIMGGLLYVFFRGPGPFSCDWFCAKEREKEA
jgi:putative oxidoreductase